MSWFSNNNFSRKTTTLDEFVERYQNRFGLNLDKDWSNRECRLYILKKIKRGTIYDNLQPFFQEYSGGSGSQQGNYVPLIQRRPSVIYRMPQIIVNASSSMLFGEGHFPQVRSDDEGTNDFLQMITRQSNLKLTMLEAADEGSIGSILVIVKVLNGKFWFDAIDTTHLHPVFDVQDPNKLIMITEKIKLDGNTLRMHGYLIKDDDIRSKFYLKREWNENYEIYYQPYLVEDDRNKQHVDIIDKERTTEHGMGFVPAVWIKNLPCSSKVDGGCTFEPGLDVYHEMDYQLSQLGRLLKYNSDPTLVIKNPSSLEGSVIIKGTGSLNLDENGDAYLLEMSTGATQSVIEYVKTLRQFALEAVRGDRSNPDHLSALHSGKALQMLNLPLTSLVDEMRLTYGNDGLLNIYRMVMRICALGIYDLAYDNIPSSKDDKLLDDLVLDWPEFYAATPQDKLQESQALAGLRGAQILSQETAIENIADEYNIIDIDEEISAIAKETEDVYNLQVKAAKDTSKAKQTTSVGQGGDN